MTCDYRTWGASTNQFLQRSSKIKFYMFDFEKFHYKKNKGINDFPQWLQAQQWLQNHFFVVIVNKSFIPSFFCSGTFQSQTYKITCGDFWPKNLVYTKSNPHVEYMCLENNNWINLL